VSSTSLKLIISGGQTGADSQSDPFGNRGGLLAARYLGIATGGFAPQGYLTETGVDLMLAELGLQETDSPSGEVRTRRNVDLADATVIFADCVDGDGTKLTLELCVALGKPYLLNPDPQFLRGWLRENKFRVLNVAGNRESIAPGLGDRVRVLLLEALVLQPENR
jgi:hypothetical protein